MTYDDTIQWLFSQLPMYQRQGKQAFKKDLNNILKLDKYLGQPSQKFKSIHIAGTNGKGSVSHMLASVLQEAGYKTGLYTSPHLKDFRERIRINGQMIRKNCVINFVKRNRSFFEANHLSFFEMTVGLAFEQFSKKQVDIAVIETGLGGRLDSTNIIRPELSIITNIGKDHTAMLGETLEKIAFEKAGIIKPATPVVIGKYQKETQAVFKEIAKKNKAELFFSQDFKTKDYETDLKGNYQAENKQTLLAAIEILKKSGWQITDKAIEIGLKNVIINTGLRGRWDILNDKPLAIADTAHNKDGLQYVLRQIQETPHNHLHFVLSFVNDKNLDEILPMFPKNADYYFSKAQIPRALNEKELLKKALQNGLKGQDYPDIKHAYKAALKQADADDLIFVGGSTFTVAEII